MDGLHVRRHHAEDHALPVDIGVAHQECDVEHVFALASQAARPLLRLLHRLLLAFHRAGQRGGELQGARVGDLGEQAGAHGPVDHGQRAQVVVGLPMLPARQP
eukprot:1090624-Alexandrium_andersonii.AAC.2